jgi:hypothetical protein
MLKRIKRVLPKQCLNVESNGNRLSLPSPEIVEQSSQKFSEKLICRLRRFAQMRNHPPPRRSYSESFREQAGVAGGCRGFAFPQVAAIDFNRQRSALEDLNRQGGSGEPPLPFRQDP